MIKEYAKQVMRGAIAHHLPTNAQPFPEQQQPSEPAPSVLLFSTAPYGVRYSFGEFGSAVLVLPPHLLLRI